MNGKSLRMSKIIPNNFAGTCIVPIDHAVTYGPIEGLANYCKSLAQVIDGGANALIMHKGALTKVYTYPELLQGNYIMHLSASTSFYSNKAYKVIVGSVEEAIKLGAVGVSLHMSLGIDEEPRMLKDFGMIAEKCHEWGMPLLAMMYLSNSDRDVLEVSHAARIAQELGADIIKLDYPGSSELMEKVLEGVQVPVVIAGGSRLDDDRHLLEMIENAMAAGAAGVSIGRNIFQHENPQLITHTINQLIHNKWSMTKCLEALRTSTNGVHT